MTVFLGLDQDSFPHNTAKIANLLSVVYLVRNTIVHSSIKLFQRDVFRAAAATILNA